eukprot:scaffold19415_cov209-Skeletonema_dohrnii-CCMP3373.AAC.2
MQIDSRYSQLLSTRELEGEIRPGSLCGTWSLQRPKWMEWGHRSRLSTWLAVKTHANLVEDR